MSTTHSPGSIRMAAASDRLEVQLAKLAKLAKRKPLERTQALTKTLASRK